MNHIAHLFLSGYKPEIILGNFITDFLKPAQIKMIPTDYLSGIQLHRHIDQFIDHHPVFKGSKDHIRPFQGKYTPVVADIYYDFILVKNWKRYTSEPFTDFKMRIYEVFSNNSFGLPDQIKSNLQSMVSADFMNSYTQLTFISPTFLRLAKRVKFDHAFIHAERDFYAIQDKIEEDFTKVFPEIIVSCQNFLTNLQN